MEDAGRKPVIGLVDIGTDTEVRCLFRSQYIDRLTEAGADILIIPQTDDEALMWEYVRASDGILLPGGGDIDPRYWGEERCACSGEPNTVRDRIEPILLETAIRENRPVLGICRGVQVMNVFSGGSLYQDIQLNLPSAESFHDLSERKKYPVHKVFLTEGSRLSIIFGENVIGVNSMHHQAIRQTAPGYLVSAVCSDGVIEGIERIGDLFCVGVQWHPEFMALEDTKQMRLFEAFVKAAADRDSSAYNAS